MKQRSSTNSLIALSFLFVAILTIGFALKTLPTIQADTLSSSSNQNSNFLALKAGENQFVAIHNITLDSELIGINGSLITLNEAKRRGIVGSVYLFEGKKVLGENLSQIKTDQQFVILINDISVSPTIYLGSVK